MKTFIKDNGPHIKENVKTEKLMKNLVIALLPIIFFGIYKNGILPYLNGYGTYIDMLKPLFMILIAVFTSFVTEFVWFKYILKERNIKEFLKESYFILPGLFLALILPINTPLFVVIIGAFFATFVAKLLFGGFGYNIFNPALTGRLFVIGAYFGLINDRGGFLNLQEVDAVTTATPLANLATNNFIGSYEALIEPYGSLWNFFTGLIPGSIAETSAILILIALVYLIAKKVISWHIPVTYIGTVFIITAVVGTYYDLGIWYPLFHVLSGGLLFGAVFMATDPVTSPTNPTSQLLYGVSLGILTVVFRFIGLYPEGVLSAILTMNLFVIIYDKIGSRARVDLKKLILPVTLLVAAISVVTIIIIRDVKSADETNKPETDPNFTIVNVAKENTMFTYNVEHKAFHGLIKADIIIEQSKIIRIDILSQSESVWKQITKEDYINKIIVNQNNLAELDAISTATWTSNYLKNMSEKTLNYHKESVNNE